MDKTGILLPVPALHPGAAVQRASKKYTKSSPKHNENHEKTQKTALNLP